MRKHALLVTTLIVMVLNRSIPETFAQRQEPVDLILVGGTIVTMDRARRVVEDGAIAIAGGRIKAIGPRSEIQPRFQARETLDTSGRLIVPGLINGHTH